MICILIVWSLTCHNKSRLENNNWIRTGIIKSRHILYFKIINRNQKCVVMYLIQNAVDIVEIYNRRRFPSKSDILISLHPLSSCPNQNPSHPATHQENPSKTIQTKRKIITLRLNQLSTVLFLLLLLLLLLLLSLLTLVDQL